jgi:hypothetical protein
LIERFKIESFAEGRESVVLGMNPKNSGLKNWQGEDCIADHNDSFSSKHHFLNDPKSREP